jgi:anti-sigma factor RsiW
MSNFDDCDNYSPLLPDDGQDRRWDQSSPNTLDNLKRDRFELLSAYLDGEVSADERRQVEQWLATDAKMQRLYTRLLKLRQGVRMMPVPPSEQPVEQVAVQVMSRLERRPKRTAMWGGMAIAALFVGAVASTFSGGDLVPSIAQSPTDTHRIVSNALPNDGLMIALDRPVIEIPKAAVSDTDALPFGLDGVQ